MDDSERYNPMFGKEKEKSLVKVFGKNLKKQRLKKRLTQEQLGELSKINYKYIGEIERGEKNPTALVVYKISKALDISIAEILSIEECSSRTMNRLKEVEWLFNGKDEKDVKKAIRLLQVFFE